MINGKTPMLRLKTALVGTLSSLLLCSQLSIAQPLDSVVAIVNDRAILASELDRQLTQARQQLAAQNNRIPPANVLQSQVMDSLILNSILLQKAEEQGIRITDRQLNDTVEKIAQRNGMTLEQFRSALISQGQDYITAREQIRQDLLIRQVQEANVNRRIRISDREVQNFLKNRPVESSNTEVLLADILIPINSPATPEIIQQAQQRTSEVYQALQEGADFAETAIATSSAPNALSGGDLGWRKVTELPKALAAALNGMRPGQFTQPVRTPSGFRILQLREVRSGEARQMVEETKVRHILLQPNEIRTPQQTQRQIELLHKRLLAGESFATLAGSLSDDPGSRSDGGNLGWTPPGKMVPEFEQVMSRTKPGQVSAPFQSRFGWHILQVQDRRSVDRASEMIEAQARRTIGARKFDEELSNWLREIRSEAYVDVKQ